MAPRRNSQRKKTTFPLSIPALGTFWLSDEASPESAAKYLHCHGAFQNALTHTGAVFMSKNVTARWSPPSGFSGRVRFRATVVEDYKTYWKNVLSPVLEVRAADAATRVRSNEIVIRTFAPYERVTSASTERPPVPIYREEAVSATEGEFYRPDQLDDTFYRLEATTTTTSSSQRRPKSRRGREGKNKKVDGDEYKIGGLSLPGQKSGADSTCLKQFLLAWTLLFSCCWLRI